MSDKNKGKFSSVIEKAVAARGEVVMFWNMFEDKLELWTERKARAEYNISFPTGFGSFMVEQCGQNSLLLEKDLQVLANYFGDKPFSLQEAASVIHEQKEITVFTLVKDFYTGDLQNALLNFRRLLFEGEAPVYMLIMLQRQLELIWQYKTGQGKVRLGKLAMQELASQARFWSFAQLASLYRNLFAVEKSLKSDGKEARRLFFEKAIMDGCRLLTK